MGIQQALFAQSQAPGEWQIVDFHRYAADGSTFTLNNLQQNDFIFVQVGADFRVPGTINDSNFTTIAQGGLNGIGFMASKSVYSSASSTLSFTVSGNAPDYGIAVAFRSPNQTGSYSETVVTSAAGNGTPSHNNAVVSLSADSLAFFIVHVDDDDASPMSGPTGTTLIAEDVNSPRGSMGMAYQTITTAGNYSWGSWTTTGTDQWLAAIRELKEV